jgi:hypothetical protein
MATRNYIITSFQNLTGWKGKAQEFDSFVVVNWSHFNKDAAPTDMNISNGFSLR